MTKLTNDGLAQDAL